MSNKRITELSGDEHGDQCHTTFVIENEGHTMANVLKSIIGSYCDVEFCGYTIPHLNENKLHFRIQTTGQIKAIDILKRGLEDLSFICDLISEHPL